MTTISNNILFELTANKGAVAERYEYNGFGAVSMYNASYNPIEYSAISNTYLFAGREYEAESGLYYYRARHYSPTFGRFLQRDPIGIWEDETNLGNGYSYVGNNGVNWVDPTGKVSPAKACADAFYEKMDRAFLIFSLELVLCMTMIEFFPLASVCVAGILLDLQEAKDIALIQYQLCMGGSLKIFFPQYNFDQKVNSCLSDYYDYLDAYLNKMPIVALPHSSIEVKSIIENYKYR